MDKFKVSKSWAGPWAGSWVTWKVFHKPVSINSIKCTTCVVDCLLQNYSTNYFMSRARSHFKSWLHVWYGKVEWHLLEWDFKISLRIHLINRSWITNLSLKWTHFWKLEFRFFIKDEFLTIFANEPIFAKNSNEISVSGEVYIPTLPQCNVDMFSI